MTKIKNFRISLRSREMARWLKKERGMDTTPELDVAIDQAAKEAKAWIEPAAIYTTLTRQIAEKTTTISFPDKAIAVSVLAVSIGPALEKEWQAAQSDPMKESLLAALRQEALSQALQFAVRLVQDQAKEEDCEMSAPVSDLPAGRQALSVASSLATLLGTARIGIHVDASGFPPYARVAWLFWTPVGKNSGRAPTGRPVGTEKVAA